MYLYPVDDAVTYTSDDLVLFREAPFACWMERLTLENPDHGIPPDPDSTPPHNSMMRQDDMAETLRAEDKDVLLVDWEAAEQQRRSATLKGMREGADFIVNGQLALGPLSGPVNLLMRTSGYSELGDYLYIPCDTQGKTTPQSAFRLCFLADLLHSLQGQLPPQLLIIRGGEIMPLQTEEHIFCYRAVKHRFMQAMREFRKHRMPDPAESSHFGRWSGCANEVLKQRAMKRVPAWQEQLDEMAEEQAPLPQRAAAVGGEARAEGRHLQPVETTRRALVSGAAPGTAVLSPGGQVPAGPTLAERARMLAPTSAPTARAAAASDSKMPAAGKARLDEQRPAAARDSLDAALENLEFIGRRHRGPLVSEPAVDEAPVPRPQRPAQDILDRDAPATAEPLPLPEVEEISLDGTPVPVGWGQDDTPEALGHDLPSGAPPPWLNPAGAWQRPARVVAPPGGPVPGLDSRSPDNTTGRYSSVDSDSATFVSPSAGRITAGKTGPGSRPADAAPGAAQGGQPAPQDGDSPARHPVFSDSLITSDSFED